MTRSSNSSSRLGMALLATVLVAAVSWPQGASAAPKDKQEVFSFETGASITGAFSQLDRSEDAVTSKIRTSTVAGHAYSLWYVVFNAPENCLDGTCGEDDIFNEPGNPGAGFNEAQIEAARISVVGGVGGGIANAGDRLKIDSTIAVGQAFDEPGTVVIGHPDDDPLAPVDGPVTGLEDGNTAEVHLVIQHHGPAHDDPELLHMQLNRFNAACNPDCADVQFAIHLA